MMRILFLAILAAAPFQDAAPVLIAKGAKQPCLAADADGAFYCAFIRNGNIELSISSDDGRTWSAPVTAIDAGGKARGGMQRGPRVAVDALKRITVTAPLCFDERELTERFPRAELWLVRSTDGGTSFGAPVQVNEKAKTAPEALHAMAVSPSGEAHVAWLDMRGRSKGQDLYYAKVVNGKPGPNLKIGETLCECCAPGIAVDGQGRPLITWRDGKTPDNRPIWYSTSRDAGTSFLPPERINRTGTRVAG